MDIEGGREDSAQVKIWYFRHEVGHGRTWNRHRALAKIWKDEDFQLFYPEDLPDLLKREDRADLAIVAGRTTSETLRARGLDLGRRASFRVLFPSWQRHKKDCGRHLAEMRKTKYHLIFPDQTMFLSQYRSAHPKVFYVDRGFDPAFFYPGSEEERIEGIVFSGNVHSFGRAARLVRMRAAHPGLVTWGRRKYRKLPALLRSGRIGWNQIMWGPPTHNACINYRVWEVVGSGTMLLCSYSKDIPLIPGVHYVGWDSDADLMRKTKLFLERDEYRKQIAEAGLEEGLAKHTWRHRALEYKEIIEAHI